MECPVVVLGLVAGCRLAGVLVVVVLPGPEEAEAAARQPMILWQLSWLLRAGACPEVGAFEAAMLIPWPGSGRVVLQGASLLWRQMGE